MRRVCYTARCLPLGSRASTSPRRLRLEGLAGLIGLSGHPHTCTVRRGPDDGIEVVQMATCDQIPIHQAEANRFAKSDLSVRRGTVAAAQSSSTWSTASIR